MNHEETNPPAVVLSTALLGAVLTYSTTGRAGVHGMTIGANGSGDYAVIFMGAANEAEAAAREYVRRLERAGYLLKSATLVVNEPSVFSEPVRIVTAPLPGMEASNAEITGG